MRIIPLRELGKQTALRDGLQPNDVLAPEEPNLYRLSRITLVWRSSGAQSLVDERSKHVAPL